MRQTFVDFTIITADKTPTIASVTLSNTSQRPLPGTVREG
jgi:hypothetical protein